MNTVHLNGLQGQDRLSHPLLTCSHDPLHTRVLDTPLHILQTPDIPIRKHRDSHGLPVGGRERSLTLYHTRAVLSQEGQRPATKFHPVETPCLLWYFCLPF